MPPPTVAGLAAIPVGSPSQLVADPGNLFTELQTTRTSSWQFELRRMERKNRLLSEELATLLANKKKRKRRKGKDGGERRCGYCGKADTPEWRRGPSRGRELCNGCGLRWAKIIGRGGGGGGGVTGTGPTSPGRRGSGSGSTSGIPSAEQLAFEKVMREMAAQRQGGSGGRLSVTGTPSATAPGPNVLSGPSRRPSMEERGHSDTSTSPS